MSARFTLAPRVFFSIRRSSKSRRTPRRPHPRRSLEVLFWRACGRRSVPDRPNAAVAGSMCQHEPVAARRLFAALVLFATFLALRETIAAPGSAPASAAAVVMLPVFLSSHDFVRAACDSGGRGTTRARLGWRGASTPSLDSALRAERTPLLASTQQFFLART